MSKVVDFILGQNSQQIAENRKAGVYKSIIHYEAKIGGELFGPVPKGSRREFFCLDERTWVWHEEWKDKAGYHVVTTRYDVRPTGVYKSQGSNSYQALGSEEARNLYNAVYLYYQKVMPELIRMQQLG
jgi:hypothetical protein